MNQSSDRRLLNVLVEALVISSVGIELERLSVELFLNSNFLTDNLCVIPVNIIVCNSVGGVVVQDLLCILNSDDAVTVVNVHCIVRIREVVLSQVASVLEVDAVRIGQDLLCLVVGNLCSDVVVQSELCVLNADLTVQVGIAAENEVNSECTSLLALDELLLLDQSSIIALLGDNLLNSSSILQDVCNRKSRGHRRG